MVVVAAGMYMVIFNLVHAWHVGYSATLHPNISWPWCIRAGFAIRKDKILYLKTSCTLMHIYRHTRTHTLTASSSCQNRLCALCGDILETCIYCSGMEYLCN